MQVQQSFTLEELANVFAIDVWAGKVYYANRTHPNAHLNGREAGYVSGKGHVVIEHNNVAFRRSHIVWLAANGAWPEQQIDHINRMPSDDRIENLRDVDNFTNCANKKSRLNKYNCTYAHGRRWRAAVRHQYKIHHLGVFDTRDEAAEAVHSFKSRMGVPDAIP